MPEYCDDIILLFDAGFTPEIEHITPIHPLALYGPPVLFGFGNRFDGIEGVRVFVDNAALLGFRRAAACR
jgi:hypothetical protein